MRRVLLTGATGFVGSHLYPALEAKGYAVRCGTRHPQAAARRHPERAWIALDLADERLVEEALREVDVVYYLVHAMAEGSGYAERERDAALRFRRVAARHGVERIIYLGGVAPSGKPSHHLQSRLDTGALLRGGEIPCVELRAGMIIGVGSESWKICRDLAVRLPFMVLPRWLKSRSQPIAIEDVIFALLSAAEIDRQTSAIFDLPGPDTLTAEACLMRIARLRGVRPYTVNVPILTPRLSSYWLKLITGADYSVACELVEGLKGDLVSTGPIFWDLFPEHALISFDEAAAAALRKEKPGPLRLRILEGLARRLAQTALHL